MHIKTPFPVPFHFVLIVSHEVIGTLLQPQRTPPPASPLSPQASPPVQLQNSNSHLRHHSSLVRWERHLVYSLQPSQSLRRTKSGSAIVSKWTPKSLIRKLHCGQYTSLLLSMDCQRGCNLLSSARHCQCFDRWRDMGGQLHEIGISEIVAYGLM